MAKRKTIRQYLEHTINNKQNGLNNQKIDISSLIEQAINSIEYNRSKNDRSKNFESIQLTISSVINYLKILKIILTDNNVTYFEDDPDYEKTAKLAISLDNLINNLNNLQPSDTEITDAKSSFLDFLERTREEPRFSIFQSEIDKLSKNISSTYPSDLSSNSNSQDSRTMTMSIIHIIHNSTPKTFDLNWIFCKKEFEIISDSIFENIQQIKKIIDDSINNFRFNSDSKLLHILEDILQSIPKAKPDQKFYLHTSAGLASLDTLKQDHHRDYKLNTYYNTLKSLQNNLLELLNKLHNMLLDSTKLNQHLKNFKNAMSIQPDVVKRILKAYIPEELLSEELEEFVNAIQKGSYDSESKKIFLFQKSVSLIENYLKHVDNNPHSDKSQSNNIKFLRTQVIPKFESYIQSIEYIESLKTHLDTLMKLIQNYCSYFFGNKTCLSYSR